MKKILLFIFCYILFFSFKTTPLFASSEFLTNYEVTYHATTDGKLSVSQDVELTNRLSNTYATQYSFTLEKAKPENIKASDSQGALIVKTKEEGDNTTVTLTFNDQVVGKDNVLKFNVNYELQNILRHSGQVWEISLPKLADIGDIETYNVTLDVPQGFGKPAYVSPLPITQNSQNSRQIFTFNKDKISNSGIVAVFGEFQLFDFNLSYHLTNPLNKPAITKVALPPDTNYQKVSYTKIDPNPVDITVDNDGNWLGIFFLEPNQKIDVKASGRAKIFPQPQTLFLPNQKVDLNKYLEPQKYWETNDPKIRELAQKYKTPRDIYDYVVKALKYDYSKIGAGTGRLGALNALSTPDQAVCTEFTDLFIAIARAAGIPARELNGYAYTNNPLLQPLSLEADVLHAWPEYWDQGKKTWIQVDPTWSNTTGGVDFFNKLDVGHFVFAIHGEKSDYPYPAGSYKDKNSTQKDVQINFGSYQEANISGIVADFEFAKEVIAERPISGKIKITNMNSEALYDLKIEIKGQNLQVKPTELTIPALPPFARREIDVTAKVDKIFPQGSGKLILLGNTQKFEYNIAYQSLILNKILPLLGVVLAISVFAIITKKAWRLYLQKRQKGNNLCGESSDPPGTGQKLL